jgi:glucose-1-phosphate thymidylyltransferase
MNELLGLILAGGRGTRFGDLTKRTPKPLLPVAGEPLIIHNIDGLRRAGITDITIVISPDSMKVEEVLGNGKTLGVSLTYVMQEQHLGTAHAIYLAREQMGDSRFLLCWSDNLTSYNLADLVDSDRAFPADGTLAVYFTDNPRKGGTAITKGRTIVEFEEKPEHPRSNLNLAGMYIMGPWLFPCIEKTSPNAKEDEYYLPDALQIAANEGKVLNWALVADWRINVNNAADLLVGNAFLLQKNPLANQARGDDVVHPPALVPSGVSIGRGATIGPFVSMGDRCTIGENANIVDAIIMSGAHIEDNAEIQRAIVDMDGTIYAERTDFTAE